MTTARETILQAFGAVIDAAKPAGAAYLRNAVLPERIPAAGIAILRDGDPGEAQVILSPLTYAWQHLVELDWVTEGDGREAAFDAGCEAFAASVAADRTLGGLVDWIEPLAPSPIDLPLDGGPEMKAATLGFRLHYDTSDPLG